MQAQIIALFARVPCFSEWHHDLFNKTHELIQLEFLAHELLAEMPQSLRQLGIGGMWCRLFDLTVLQVQSLYV